jgi:hypothetical protein
MGRNTRKQLVGKHIENLKEVERLRELGVWQRLAKWDWWSRRLGQVSAGEMLPLESMAEAEEDEERE